MTAEDHRDSDPAEGSGGEGADAPADDAPLQRPLPEEVRQRLAEYASEVLGVLPAAEIPRSLRRVARFEPRRRARLAGPQIGAQLEADPEFRATVAEHVARAWPELAHSVADGAVPPAADPVVVAAVAYLQRPPGWTGMVDRLRTELREQEAARDAADTAAVIEDLRRQLQESRQQHRREVERLRGDLHSARSTIADLRRALNQERQRAKEAEAAAEASAKAAAEQRDAAQRRQTTVESENRRLARRLETAEAQLDAARRASREGRSADAARLRTLVSVLVDAAHGLRRELALPTDTERPADLVARSAEPGGPRALAELSDNDPALVDKVLAVPGVHLLIDGYNVTKSGYAHLPLADQRARLVTALEGLASRTKAEITCVFDGADVAAPAAATGRLRVLFSEPGETADDLIVRLVRAEPPGRPVAVVSSDREIATAITRAGARSLDSALLLSRLERG